MSKPEPGNPTTYQELFHQEIARGEKVAWVFRWILYLLVMVLAAIVWRIQGHIAGFYGLFIALVPLVYNALISPLVIRANTTAWIRYLSVTVDIVALTTYNLVDTLYYSPLAPITTASLLLYPILIFIASLRQDWPLVIYATVVSSLGMNAVWLFAWPLYDHAFANTLSSGDPAGQVYRTLYILVFGGLVSFVPATIRRLLGNQKAMLLREQKAQAMARLDPLTGLANRTCLMEDLAMAIALAQRNQMGLALLYIDLDGFKPINDTHGHKTGDEVLVILARRIQAELRGSDLAARVGGDEFVVLAQGMGQVEAATILAHRILDAIGQPIVMGTIVINPSASIGLALFPQHASDASTLLVAADEAMYRIKHGDKHGIGLAG